MSHNPYYSDEELARQQRLSYNARVRLKHNLAYKDVVQILGESRAFALSRADDVYSQSEIERIEEFKREKAQPRFL
jgi:hypothetical protein